MEELDLGCLTPSPVRSRGNRRKDDRGRRRKTLSPSRVSTFLDDVELGDDPLKFPDPPGAGSSLGAASKYPPPPQSASRRPSNSANGGHYASRSDVAGLLDMPSLEPNRPSISPVASPMRFRRPSDEVVREVEGRATPPRPHAPGKRSVLSSIDNIQNRTPEQRTQKKAAHNHREKTPPHNDDSPLRIGSPGSSFDGTNEPRRMVACTTIDDAEAKRNRRRSFELPGEVMSMSSASPEKKVRSIAPSSRGGPSPPGIKRVTATEPAPAVPEAMATATDGFDIPPLKLLGYAVPIGNENDLGRLCRAFAAADPESQLGRRIAARVFMLTGYPLLPMAARDAQALLKASGGPSWPMDEDSTDVFLDGEPIGSSGSSKEIKRALVMRLRPVLERMEEISKEEKSSVESATGMVPRRTNVGGYEYVECATGQVSDAEEYVARYLTYVDKAKAERLIAAQVMLNAMGRTHPSRPLLNCAKDDGAEAAAASEPQEVRAVALRSVEQDRSNVKAQAEEQAVAEALDSAEENRLAIEEAALRQVEEERQNTAEARALEEARRIAEAESAQRRAKELALWRAIEADARAEEETLRKTAADDELKRAREAEAEARAMEEARSRAAAAADAQRARDDAARRYAAEAEAQQALEEVRRREATEAEALRAKQEAILKATEEAQRNAALELEKANVMEEARRVAAAEVEARTVAIAMEEVRKRAELEEQVQRAEEGKLQRAAQARCREVEADRQAMDICDTVDGGKASRDSREVLIRSLERRKENALKSAETALWQAWDDALSRYHATVEAHEVAYQEELERLTPSSSSIEVTQSLHISRVQNEGPEEELPRSMEDVSPPVLLNGGSRQQASGRSAQIKLSDDIFGDDIASIQLSLGHQTASGTRRTAAEEALAADMPLAAPCTSERDDICELCCDHIQSITLEPCGHSMCGRCKEKLQIKCDSTGSALLCPWDRMDVTRVRPIA